MPKIIIFIFFNLIFINLTYSNEKNPSYGCKWQNETSTPCIEINSLTTNSSNYSTPGINKTIISKSKIEEIGAVDLIDVLKYTRYKYNTIGTKDNKPQYS